MADRAASMKQVNAKANVKPSSSKPARARFRYLGEAISELKKVVWLSRQETAYLTALVIIVAAAVGIILGALDFGFAALIDKILLGR